MTIAALAKAVKEFDRKLAEAKAAGEKLVAMLREIFPEADIHLGDWELGFNAVTIRRRDEDFRKNCYLVPIDELMAAITIYRPQHVYWNALDPTEDEAVAVLRDVGWGGEAAAREWAKKHRYWYD